MRKRIFIIVSILLIVILTSIIIVFRNYNKVYKIFDYNILSLSKHYKHDLIKDSLTVVSLDYSIGNKNDTIFIYEIDEKYRLFIYSIKGFSDIKFGNLREFSTDNFDLIKWNPVGYFSFGNESLIIEKRIDDYLNASEINIVTKDDSKINKKDFDSLYIHYDINLTGLAVCDSFQKYQFRLFFKEKSKHSDILLYKLDNRFYFILFYRIDDTDKDNSVFNVIKLK